MQTKLSQDIELYHSNHGHARTTFIQIMVMQELYTIISILTCNDIKSMQTVHHFTCIIKLVQER